MSGGLVASRTSAKQDEGAAGDETKRKKGRLFSSGPATTYTIYKPPSHENNRFLVLPFLLISHHLPLAWRTTTKGETLPCSSVLGWFRHTHSLHRSPCWTHGILASWGERNGRRRGWGLAKGHIRRQRRRKFVLLSLSHTPPYLFALARSTCLCISLSPFLIFFSRRLPHCTGWKP